MQQQFEIPQSQIDAFVRATGLKSNVRGVQAVGKRVLHLY
jgi:hypothetical protein